ncbi:hypothetical protein GF420_04260 [candidate division GN15 bacterium]|nr:hypothetical protein [candidate division GN15 bacterium]
MARRKAKRRNDESRDVRDSFLVNVVSKFGLGLFVVVIFLTLVQCSIKKPEAPEWNTNLNVPVVNRTYTMAELVDKIDQEGISMNEDSNVVYSFSEDLDTVRLDNDNLTTDDMSYSVSQQLGVIDLDPPTIAPVATDFVDIVGLAAGVVPPGSFQIDSDMPAIDNYSEATIDQATMWVVVDNNLGLDLDTVTITLWDVSRSQTVGTQSIPGGVANGQIDSLSFILDGRQISNQFEVRADCYTPGGTVLSASGKNITVSVRFDGNLSVTAATAKVPSLSRNFSEVVDLGEADPVYRATLNDGQLQLTVTNNTALDATLDIALPDLVQGVTPLTVSRNVAPYSNDVVTVYLDGYDLLPRDSTVPQQITVDVVADVPGSGDNLVPVSAGDDFSVDASLTGLGFSSVTGRFASTEATIEPTSEEIDVPKGFDEIQLAQAIVTLEVDNHVNMPGSLDVTLEGSNGKVKNFTGTVAAGTPGGSTVSYIFDSTVADFLSPLPEQIDISGTAVFGDGVSVTTINADDYVVARVNILAPLEFSIAETSIDSDIESEDIDVDDIDVVTDHVVQAQFHYNIVNHLPIGVDINVLLGSDSTTLLTNPELRITGLSVNAAPVMAGVVVDTLSTGMQVIVLDSADIQVLKTDTLYIAQELVLHSTGGQVVKLTSNDYLTVSGYLEVEYRFDGEF